MSLYIKLPKGKAADAYKAKADEIQIVLKKEWDEFSIIQRAYLCSFKLCRRKPKPPSANLDKLVDHLRAKAKACHASTGDVYVSFEDWCRIKGYYRVN